MMWYIIAMYINHLDGRELKSQTNNRELRAKERYVCLYKLWGKNINELSWFHLFKYRRKLIPKDKTYSKSETWHVCSLRNENHVFSLLNLAHSCFLNITGTTESTCQRNWYQSVNKSEMWNVYLFEKQRISASPHGHIQDKEMNSSCLSTCSLCSMCCCLFSPNLTTSPPIFQREIPFFCLSLLSV